MMNFMCSTACQYLSRGAWPQLSNLGLRQCKIDVDGLHQILKGCWPDIEVLNLDQNNVKSYECLPC